MADMDDSSINGMVNMMKSNPSMMKMAYEQQMGRKMSDVEFNNIMSMMNPNMIKTASKMMKENPDMVN